MNQRTDNERLLADVLASETDAGFRAGVLAETLRGVRRRRRFRQLRRCGNALGLLLLVALLASRVLRNGVNPELTRAPQPINYQLVVSQSLASGQRVSTQPLATDQRVTSTGTAPLVQTASGGFQEIGDEELMALAAPRIVALVRRGPQDAELIFVASPEVSDSRQN